MAEQGDLLPATAVRGPFGWTMAFAVVIFPFLLMLAMDIQEEYDREYATTVAHHDADRINTQWRNAFWEDVTAPEGSPVTHDADLVRSVRMLFFQDGPMRAEEWNEVVLVLQYNASGRLHGILTSTGSFTDESMRQIERIQQDGTFVPEEPPPAQADPIRRNAYREMFDWRLLLFGWTVCAWTGYAFGRICGAAPWFGITRIRGAYVERGLVALLYAPPFLFLAVCLAIWRGLWFLLFDVPSWLRSWWMTRKNPYRAQIREAVRALAELRMLDADSETIRGAEELLELWRTRHDDETNKATDEAAKARREARINNARDTLLRLDADAVADGIKREPRRHASRQPTGSS